MTVQWILLEIKEIIKMKARAPAASILRATCSLGRWQSSTKVTVQDTVYRRRSKSACLGIRGEGNFLHSTCLKIELLLPKVKVASILTIMCTVLVIQVYPWSLFRFVNADFRITMGNGISHLIIPIICRAYIITISVPKLTVNFSTWWLICQDSDF